MVFIIFAITEVRLDGDIVNVPSLTGRRGACAACGSVMCWIDERAGEIELYAGHFSQPALFTPSYEVWTLRREAWLPNWGLPQYPRDRRQGK